MLGTWGLVKLFYFSERFSYFVSALLKVEDLPGTAILMLPLGFSVATIANGIMHWIAFEKEFKGFSRGVTKTLVDCFGASIIMGAVAYAGLNILVLFIDTTTLPGIFLQGAISGLLAIACGIVTLFLLKNQEQREIWNTIHQRFWKTKVIATDPEIV